MNENTEEYKYELDTWEGGTLVTPAKVDLTTGIVTPAVYSGNTPITPERLEIMNQGIKKLYEEGAISKDIYIGPEEEAPSEAKIVIEPNENSYDELKYRNDNELKNIYLPPTGDTLPVGSIVAYSSSTAPTNWLICDGSAISRTTYSELFNIIGTSFGSGDGSTTFNIPNLKGSIPVGLDSSDTVQNYIIKAKNSVGLVGNVTNAYSESTQDAYSCNYINDNLQNKLITLYDNLSGTTGNITLSSDVSNYSYLRIFCGVGSDITRTNSIDVIASAGSGFIYCFNSTSSDVGIYCNSIFWSGTTLTRGSGVIKWFGGSSSTENQVKIFRILGVNSG